MSATKMLDLLTEHGGRCKNMSNEIVVVFFHIYNINKWLENKTYLQTLNKWGSLHDQHMLSHSEHFLEDEWLYSHVGFIFWSQFCGSDWVNSSGPSDVGICILSAAVHLWKRLQIALQLSWAVTVSTGYLLMVAHVSRLFWGIFNTHSQKYHFQC